jgi:hypothetical protein
VDRLDREAGSRRDEASRFLAEQWGLEFREAHTLSIDPAALKVIAAADAKRIGAFPLSLEAGRPVFAIAEPSTERLDSVRAISREDASFVIVCPSTLEALLSSKIFNASSNREAAERPAHAAMPPTAQALDSETAVKPEAGEPEPGPQLPDRRVDSPTPGSRTPTEPPYSRSLDLTDSPGGVQIERRPTRPLLVAVGPQGTSDSASERLGSLLTQITAGASHLASQADELVVVLEDNQRELRAARAQLEEARLAHHKTESELEALRTQLVQSQTLNEALVLRLRELVQALEGAQPGGEWKAGATAAALEASTRIA